MKGGHFVWCVEIHVYTLHTSVRVCISFKLRKKVGHIPSMFSQMMHSWWSSLHEVTVLSWMCLSKRIQFSESSSSEPSDNMLFFHLFQVSSLSLEDLNAFLALILCLKGKSAAQLTGLQVWTGIIVQHKILMVT